MLLIIEPRFTFAMNRGMAPCRQDINRLLTGTYVKLIKPL